MKKIPVRYIKSAQKNKLMPGSFNIRRVEEIQYASRLHLSAYQLNEITKATVGKTASGVIISTPKDLSH